MLAAEYAGSCRLRRMLAAEYAGCGVSWLRSMLAAESWHAGGAGCGVRWLMLAAEYAGCGVCWLMLA